MTRTGVSILIRNYKHALSYLNQTNSTRMLQNKDECVLILGFYYDCYKQLELTDDKKSEILSKRDILLKGTIIALILTIPSLIGFAISWMITDDLLVSAVIGGLIHFVAMGFSLKISKKLLIKR